MNYVDTNGKPNSLKVNEYFLGYIYTENQSAALLSEQIIQYRKKGLSLSKCKGPRYDEAPNMSGMYNGVQKKL